MKDTGLMNAHLMERLKNNQFCMTSNHICMYTEEKRNFDFK